MVARYKTIDKKLSYRAAEEVDPSTLNRTAAADKLTAVGSAIYKQPTVRNLVQSPRLNNPTAAQEPFFSPLVFRPLFSLFPPFIHLPNIHT
jgi:hypothetical protein